MYCATSTGRSRHCVRVQPTCSTARNQSPRNPASVITSSLLRQVPRFVLHAGQADWTRPSCVIFRNCAACFFSFPTVCLATFQWNIHDVPLHFCITRNYSMVFWRYLGRQCYGIGCAGADHLGLAIRFCSRKKLRRGRVGS